MADPTSVPNEYIPNTNLKWVERATHIWAIHPSNTLKADKGGFLLNLDGSTPDNTTIHTDNTMIFNGGTWLQTLNQFIVGDNPYETGNQTPSVNTGMSAWVLFTAFHATNPMGIFGGYDPAGPLVYVDTTGHIKVKIGPATLTYATALALNTWYHIAVTNDQLYSGYKMLYVNGVAVQFSPDDSVALANDNFQIGHCKSDTLTIEPFNGRMRLMAVVNGGTWPEAEILEQYQRPYGYYAPLESPGLVLSELKTELETDPVNTGYAPFIASGEMEALADLLNERNNSGIDSVFRDFIPSMEINSFLDDSEYYDLAPERRLLWNAYTQADIDMKKVPQMRGQIEHLFPLGSQTVSELRTYCWVRESSRAEVLWGVGITIRWQDCAEALALP